MSLSDAELLASASAPATSATKPPVIEAVRVPPSAWMTSQSIQIVRSPSSFSCVDRAQRSADQPLDLLRPAADLAGASPRAACGSWSRAAACRTPRSPSPCRCCAGTAARGPRRWPCRSRVVRPTSISTEPSACARKPGVMVVGRSSRGRTSVSACHRDSFSTLTHSSCFCERMPQVDVTCECVDFLAVDRGSAPAGWPAGSP